jgi:hypothetical protein
LLEDNDKIAVSLAACLYLLEALMERHKDDIVLLQATADLFELADPRELATQLQLRDRKVVITKLWESFRSDDRRKRVIVA